MGPRAFTGVPVQVRKSSGPLAWELRHATRDFSTIAPKEIAKLGGAANSASCLDAGSFLGVEPLGLRLKQQAHSGRFSRPRIALKTKDIEPLGTPNRTMYWALLKTLNRFGNRAGRMSFLDVEPLGTRKSNCAIGHFKPKVDLKTKPDESHSWVLSPLGTCNKCAIGYFHTQN